MGVLKQLDGYVDAAVERAVKSALFLGVRPAWCLARHTDAE
jgi:hypothetical protein